MADKEQCGDCPNLTIECASPTCEWWPEKKVRSNLDECIARKETKALKAEIESLRGALEEIGGNGLVADMSGCYIGNLAYWYRSLAQNLRSIANKALTQPTTPSEAIERKMSEQEKFFCEKCCDSGLITRKIKSNSADYEEINCTSCKPSRVFMDGGSWCAVYPGFTNLQESPAGFGDTPKLAREDLAKMDCPECGGSGEVPDEDSTIPLHRLAHGLFKRKPCPQCRKGE